MDDFAEMAGTVAMVAALLLGAAFLGLVAARFLYGELAFLAP